MQRGWLALALIIIVAFYWASSLSFFPVPWPDDSAFYLTGVEWIHSPSRYLMHSQAPWVPSYDAANFNTMPGMPLLLGLGNLVGISSPHAIRLYGMIFFAAWAWLLAVGMGAPRRWTWLVAIAAITCPAIRWGAMVVRPEVWVCLLWLLITLEIGGGFWRRPHPWRIPLFLALGAYIHFEAVFWVLPTALGLFPWSSRETFSARTRTWARRLVGVTWRTLALLSPWLIYLLVHWSDFWSQMHTQFHRLAAEHPYLQSPHGVFHTLWISLGNPIDYPKFLNAGKFLFWGGSLLALAHAALGFAKEPATRGIRAALVAAYFSTWYLWASKPETWFTVMIHMTMGTLMAYELGRWVRANPSRMAQGALGAAAVALIVVQSAVAWDQWRKTREEYTWSNYHAWVDCLERGLAGRKKIWQPHWPDALNELKRRDFSRDLTRAVDFQGVDELIEKHAANVDAVLHSIFIPYGHADWRRRHEGAPTESDRHWVGDFPWMPFKNFARAEDPKSYACQVGPFWALLSFPRSKP
ncbi:MAG: hypothetical protein AB7F66_15970 [Bacteriovoracia bacterium]